jgi:hypothetical protein
MILLARLDERDRNAYYDGHGNRYLVFSHNQLLRLHNLLLMQQLYQR